MNKHRFHLVLPNDIWQRLKALAERNRRPITQEIIVAILDKLANDPVDRFLEDLKLKETLKDLEKKHLEHKEDNK